MHSIDNLFKLNELNVNKKNTNYESMHIDELKQNEKTFRTMISNKKLIYSLSDKGEKIKQQLKHIEQLIESRAKQQEASNKENHLEDLIDKIQEIKIEKPKNEEKNSKEEEKSATNSSTVVKEAKENYFARPVKQNKASKPLVNKENLNIDEVKQKVKTKLQEKGKVTHQAKEIPFEECVKLLQEREKRVQKYQLEQTAKKLIEGQSVTYDYSFAAKAENLKYQERKSRSNMNDDLLSDNESDLEEEDDYEYYECYRDEEEYGEEVDDKSSKIDRVYKTKLEKNKFKPNLDDLEKVD